MRTFQPIKLLSLLTALAFSALGAGSALAAGTAAGVDVTNNVTLDFTVNNTAQTQQTAAATFKVDRKLVVNVTSNDGDYVTATPGATATMSFTLANLSNNDASDPLSAVFAVVRKADQVTGFTNGGLAAAGAADGAAFTVRVDIGGNVATLTADANGVFNLNSHPAYSGTGALAADDDVTVLVDAVVDTNAANNDYQSFTVVASLADAGGTVISNDDSGNVVPGGTPAAATADGAATVEDVFADAAGAATEDTQYTFAAATPNADGNQDAANNNQHSDTSGVRVATAAIALTKTAEVLWDPVSGNKYNTAGTLATGALPKAIPGAVVMYVVAVKNGQAGVTPAFDIAISDTVPAQMNNGNEADEAVNLPATSASGADTLTIPEIAAGSRAVLAADVAVRVKSCASSTFDITSNFAGLAAGITVNPTGGTGCGDGNGFLEDADYAIYVYVMTVQ